jgi:uncharacterized YccA/Bax inhibitor family protein
MFKAEWSAVLAPLYAVMEGLSLGLWSMLFEIVYPGIVFQAVLLTFGVAFGMLLLYKTRIVRVTERFQMVIAAALFGIAAFYLVSFVLSIFGIHVSALTISGGIFGIAFNVFVVVIAALSLACDFDFIVKISDRGLPKYLSWLAALGLAVGLVYLYVNILRLLARFRER